MQQNIVLLAILLYTAFSFNPIAEISIFSRTLNLSPGDMITMLLVMGVSIKALAYNQKDMIIKRPPAVIRFLFSYIFLATVFFLSTLLFFLFHNEMAQYLPRSLFIYLLWSIAPLLFYYGSDSQLNLNKLTRITWILMVTFLAGVMGNIFIKTNDFNLFVLLTNTFQSQNVRLGGQIADPNQLGTLAAFFSTIGIMGALYEKKVGVRFSFVLLTAGTGSIILLTQSRESILTLFVAVICVGVFLMQKKLYSKAFIIAMGLIMGTVFSVMNIPRIVETLSAMDVGDTGYALSARGRVWEFALKIISNYPLGIGFENMAYFTDNSVLQAHNAFLQSAIVGGALGFISFLCFLVFLFQLFRAGAKLVPENWMLEAYFAFSVGYLATSLGSDHFISFYTFNAVFFGLLGFVVSAR